MNNKTNKDDILHWMTEFIVNNIMDEGEDPSIYYNEIEGESAGVWQLINEEMLHGIFLDYKNQENVTVSFRSILCKRPTENLGEFYQWCLELNEEIKIKHLSLDNDDVVLNDIFIIQSIGKEQFYDSIENQANASFVIRTRMAERFNIRIRSPEEVSINPSGVSLLSNISKSDLN